MTTFALFSFLLLRSIRGTYSKHFQNNIYETKISSTVLSSTTLCSFARILYTFNVCSSSLDLFYFFHLRLFYCFSKKYIKYIYIYTNTNANFKNITKQKPILQFEKGNLIKIN